MDNDGAGFALCWQGKPQINIGSRNRDRELVQVYSDSMSIIIPRCVIFILFLYASHSSSGSSRRLVLRASTHRDALLHEMTGSSYAPTCALAFVLAWGLCLNARVMEWGVVGARALLSIVNVGFSISGHIIVWNLSKWSLLIFRWASISTNFAYCSNERRLILTVVSGRTSSTCHFQ